MDDNQASSIIEKIENKTDTNSILEVLASPEELTAAFADNRDLAMFFVAWLNCGLNATQAYLKLHPEVTDASARVLGSRQLAKVNIRTILEAYGLGFEKYFSKLIDGLEASKWNPEVKDYDPDYKTRRLYHEALGKLLGIEKNTSQNNAIAIGSYNNLGQQNNNIKFYTTDELKDAMRENILKHPHKTVNGEVYEINPTG